MRSQFEFHFTTQTISFAGRHELKGRLEVTPIPGPPEHGLPPTHSKDDLAEIEIAAEPRDPQSGQVSGKLLITLPGPPDEAAALARRLANDLEEHIKFFYGDFELGRGSLIARRIAQTDEEAAGIGDSPYWADLSLVSVSDPPRFSDDVLFAFPVYLRLRHLISQYNRATVAGYPVDAYLNWFKILESAFHRGSGRARASLKSNHEFRTFLASEVSTLNPDGSRTPLDDVQVNELIDRMVAIRDRCAHLRQQEGFGYAPTDPEVLVEVRPHGEVLQSLARRTIILEYLRLGVEVPDPLFSRRP
jgi:hypothetical protein